MPAKTRNINLDIIKGMLVILMILFHCASTAKTSNPDLHIIMRYLDFLHFAFILICGYICGYYYFERFDADPSGTSERLRKRAGSLLLIFLAANAFLYATSWFSEFDTARLWPYFHSADSILNNFIWEMNNSLVAFQVLYYISAFLLLASLIIGKISLLGNLLLFQLVAALSFFSRTFLFVAFGIIGLMAGMVFTKASVQGFIRKNKKLFTVFPLILILYLINFDIRGVILMNFRPLYMLIVLAEISLWFISFIVVIRSVNINSITAFLVIFGKYTLLAYMVQMLIIKLIHAQMSRYGLSSTNYYLISTVGTTFLLYVFITGVDRARFRLRFVDTLYRYFFS